MIAQRIQSTRALSTSLSAASNVVSSKTLRIGSLLRVPSRTISSPQHSYPRSYINSFTNNHQVRPLSTTPTMSAANEPQKTGDWSSKQYLKFSNERTRPVQDLVSQLVPLLSHLPNPRIYDLGCGPANSTTVLREAFPNARITGMDSSPDMIAKARKTLPNTEFQLGDLETFEFPTEESGVDLVFSNAVFHWLRQPTRIPTLTRLFEKVNPGGVIAFQMPDNYTQPSHALMRSVASQPSKPWSQAFSGVRIGDLSDSARPDLDPIEPLETYYNALVPLASNVNIWRTTYMHVLESPGAIVEWVRGTGLQPYLNMLGEAEKEAFLKEYLAGLEGSYERMKDGKVLLGYPRLFVFAVRK